MKHQFKTNINCGSCVRLVTPYLNEEANIKNWEVDTNNPNKVLTVETEMPANKVMEVVKEAGFEITALS